MKGSEGKPGGRRQEQQEIIWDIFDRCFLPVVFSHAAAVIVSSFLNITYISQISTFSLFILFLIVSVGSTIFYHNLKVTAAGKSVLISGCESRIGYAAAKHLDELGFTVFACFDNLGETSAKLKQDSSGRLHVLKLDASSEESIQAVYSFIVEHFNGQNAGLWAVINASSWAALGEVEWVPLDVYRKSVELNLLGTIRLTQVLLPLVRKTKGRIVNVLSILGRVPSAVRSPFCIVKSALEAFSECLRIEVKRWGVDVVVIEPGLATTATWFDNKAMLDQAREMWSYMNDQAREDCGEKCFESTIRSMKEYEKGSEGDLSVILRCLGDSVTRTFPMTRYTPVSQEEKIEAFINQHLPRSVYDIIYKS